MNGLISVVKAKTDQDQPVLSLVKPSVLHRGFIFDESQTNFAWSVSKVTCVIKLWINHNLSLFIDVTHSMNRYD